MTGNARGPARLYVAFDDTDTIDADRGTGKVGRWFEDELPPGCVLWGVVRQQLLVHPDVPYTSHNSSAVCVVDVHEALTVVGEETGRPAPAADLIDEIVVRAEAHLARAWMDGSDPGLCVAWGDAPALDALRAFGVRATRQVVTQADAYAAARGMHLSGHGGTEDGVIGAAAGAGLTAGGWHGRFIEYRSALGHLRDLPDPVTVALLDECGITVVTVDRDAPAPPPEALVHTAGWLRPRLWAGRPVLPVQRSGRDAWVAVGPRTLPGPGHGGSPDVDTPGPA